MLEGMVLGGTLAVLLAIGVPIAYSVGLSAMAYFFVFEPGLAQILPQRMMSGMNSFVLIALPLFILMGLTMNAATITQRLIDISLIFVGRLRGGLGLVNVIASMIFGGISGSSASDVASIGSVLIPEMRRRGYPAGFAAGITVASSTMGMIIPPSVVMVIYAIVAQESVGRLFLGGAVPGIMIGLFQLSLVFIIAHRQGHPKEMVDTSPRHVFDELRRSILILAMPFFIVGVVTFGIATATESAGLAVVYALILGFVIIRKLTVAKFIQCLREAAITSSKIMIIVAASQMYIWVLALERVPERIAGVLANLDLGPTGMMMLINVIVLIAGTFIDIAPAILLLTPVFLPAAVAVGVDPVLFGVILVTGLAVGACTPPVGNCLNVCSVVSGMRIGEIFKGALPFLTANVTTLVLITLFPDLVLWLPNTIMGQ